MVLNFFVNKKGFLLCPFFFFLIFSSFPRSISLVFLSRDIEHGGCFCFLGHAPSFPCLVHLLFLFPWWARSTTVLPSSVMNTGHVLVAITDFKCVSCTVWWCCSYNRGLPPVWVKPDWASKASCPISSPRPPTTKTAGRDSQITTQKCEKPDKEKTIWLLQNVRAPQQLNSKTLKQIRCQMKIFRVSGKSDQWQNFACQSHRHAEAEKLLGQPSLRQPRDSP